MDMKVMKMKDVDKYLSTYNYSCYDTTNMPLGQIYLCKNKTSCYFS